MNEGIQNISIFWLGVGMARNETLDIDVCATFSCKGKFLFY